METKDSRKIITTAYFDRSFNTIEGKFSIQTVKFENGSSSVIKAISQLPARSGQNGYTSTSWVRGKSPIPFSTSMGFLYLWLSPANPGLEVERDPKKIGEFYPISSSRENKRLITDGTHERWDIGAHDDNDRPGSAGCVVWVRETNEQKERLAELKEYLRELRKTQEYIRFIVL